MLQKHALVEADIAIQAERVRGVNASAQKFATDGEGKILGFTLRYVLDQLVMLVVTPCALGVQRDRRCQLLVYCNHPKSPFVRWAAT